MHVVRRHRPAISYGIASLRIPIICHGTVYLLLVDILSKYTHFNMQRSEGKWSTIRVFLFIRKWFIRKQSSAVQKLRKFSTGFET